jgi:gas vesicle protein
VAAMMFWRRQAGLSSEALRDNARKTLGTFTKNAPRVQIGTEQRSNMGWFPGILLGITAGLVLGFLMAPARGEDTRTQVAKRVGDYTKELPERTTGISATVRSASQMIMGRFSGTPAEQPARRRTTKAPSTQASSTTKMESE